MEKSMQHEMHQEDIKVDIPSSIVGNRNHEIKKRCMDTQEIMGDPKKSMR